MKTRELLLMSGLLSVAIMTAANAHEPSKHKAGRKEPDCSSMHGMEQSLEATDDPVMQAMMMRCRDAKGEHEMMAEDGRETPDKETSIQGEDQADGSEAPRTRASLEDFIK